DRRQLGEEWSHGARRADGRLDGLGTNPASPPRTSRPSACCGKRSVDLTSHLFGPKRSDRSARSAFERASGNRRQGDLQGQVWTPKQRHLGELRFRSRAAGGVPDRSVLAAWGSASVPKPPAGTYCLDQDLVTTRSEPRPHAPVP